MLCRHRRCYSYSVFDDMIRDDRKCSSCVEKPTNSQLNLPHGTTNRTKLRVQSHLAKRLHHRLVTTRVKIGMWFMRHESGQTDRQTDRQTHRSQYFARLPGDEETTTPINTGVEMLQAQAVTVSCLH